MVVLSGLPWAVPLRYAPENIPTLPKVAAILVFVVPVLAAIGFIGWSVYRTKREEDSLDEARENAPDLTEL